MNTCTKTKWIIRLGRRLKKSNLSQQHGKERKNTDPTKNLRKERIIAENVEPQIGHQNTIVQQKNSRCYKWKKVGHFAKVYRTGNSIQYIKDEIATSADEANWTPEKIFLITEQINATTLNGIPRNEFFTKRLLVNGRLRQRITGSTGTKIEIQ